MLDMNICIFTGRLTRDAEVKRSAEGAEFLTMSIANNASNNSTNFLDMTVFSPKQVESGKKYFKKGVKLELRTHVDMRQYTDRNGNQRTATGFIVDDWGFCERKRDEEGYIPAPSQAPQYASGPAPSAPSGMPGQPSAGNYPPVQPSLAPTGGYVPASNNFPQGGSFPQGNPGDFMDIPESDLEEELPFN